MPMIQAKGQIIYPTGQSTKISLGNHTPYPISVKPFWNIMDGDYLQLFIKGRFVLVKEEICFESADPNSPLSAYSYRHTGGLGLSNEVEAIQVVPLGKKNDTSESFQVLIRYQGDPKTYKRQGYISLKSSSNAPKSSKPPTTPNFPPFHPKPLTIEEATQRWELISKQINDSNKPQIKPHWESHRKFLAQLPHPHPSFPPIPQVFTCPSGARLFILCYDSDIKVIQSQKAGNNPNYPNVFTINGIPYDYSNDDCCIAIYKSRDARGKEVIVSSWCDVDLENSYSTRPNVQFKAS